MPGLPSPNALLLGAATLDDSLEPIRRDALYGAAGLLVAALVVLIVTAIATRPRRPRPGEATMDLGPEPPAVVDLLTDDFEVTSEAVPATLLDLAARRWVSLEQYGEATICRLRSTGRGTLAPYEQRVLSHLRATAADGVVPAEALTTGPEAASDAWWRSFRQEVVADARARGLCRRRWPPVVAGIAWMAVIGAAGLLWASGVDSNDEGLGALALGVFAGLFVVGGTAGRITSSDRQRDTPAGLEAGGRWLGVRRYLAEHGDFAEQPAAAVEVWDRYLAHAAAMDLAGLAVQQLPLGAEDDRHAWSAVTGEWRPVTVAYPRFEPGWGRHPAAAIALGLSGFAASTATMWASYRFAHDTDLGGRLTLDPVLLSRAGWVALLACLAFAALGAYAAFALWRGLADLFSTGTVTGVVLRARARDGGLQAPKVVRYFTDPERRGSNEREPRWYLAVDTGEVDQIDAWRVRRRHYRQVHQHQQVQVERTPRLGYVRRVTVVPPAAEAVPGVTGVTVAADTGDADLLAAARALSVEE